jgi:ribosomal protein S18 acetylase RimI-like enzyme
MAVTLRPAREADAERVASLMTELGYSSTAKDVKDRLRGSLNSQTSCCLVAQADSEVIGMMSLELIPYFPTGSTICRVTSLVVSSRHRSRGVGEKLMAAAAKFARERGCSGIEVTSADRRVDAHRFYQRLGFARAGLRFFQAL